MGTQLYQDTEVTIRYDQGGYPLLKRFILMRFHPRKIIFDIVGVMWAVHFLWINSWPAALLSALLFSGLGWFFVRQVNPYQMAQTTLGKLGLLHLHPFNITVQSIGLIPLIYGLWIHSAEHILVGLSLLFIGHFYGWSRVDENLGI